jgi:uncharacterized membrane protein HdeD (DUF308 family)
MSAEFEFHHNGKTHRIEQNGRYVVINGKSVPGLRKWMVYVGVTLAWFGLLAIAPLLATILFCLALVAGAVYLLTRD